MYHLRMIGNFRLHVKVGTLLTQKKFTNESSGTSATVGTDDDDGSRGPSISDKVGTASNSSNSLMQNRD